MTVLIVRIALGLAALFAVAYVVHFIWLIRSEHGEGKRSAAQRAEQARLAEVGRKQAERVRNVEKYGEETVAGWERDHQASLERAEREKADAEAARLALPWWQRNRPRDQVHNPVLILAAMYAALSVLFALASGRPVWPPTYLLGTFALAGGLGLIPAILYYFQSPMGGSRIGNALGALLMGVMIGMMIAGLLLLLAIPAALFDLARVPYETGPCTKGSPWNC